MIGSCFDNEFLNENNIVLDDETKLFELELPKSKVKVSLRLADGIAEKEIAANSDNEESAVTSLLATFLCAVNGDESAVSEFINVMPAADSRYLRKIYLSLTPSVEMKDNFICDSCGYFEETEVPLTAEFFWPR